jgi:plasmid stabilization system protein ParE
MTEIARYISHELQNPDAAEKLADAMIEAVEEARTFPYAAPPYFPIRPLKYNYRKLLVQNYLIFYWVDDQARKITVARAIYAKRDYASLLK